MPFADKYIVSAHPPLPLHSKVPRPWALDTYSTVQVLRRKLTFAYRNVPDTGSVSVLDSLAKVFLPLPTYIIFLPFLACYVDTLV